jgi:hypothetical protein
VPPPPVCGAVVGVGAGLVAGLGVGDRGGVLDTDGLGEGLALVVVLLNAVEGWWVGSVVVEDGLQPATATQARMAKTPKRTTVSLALSTAPAITRTVM